MADLKERVGEEGYVSALPDDAEPRSEMADKAHYGVSPRSGPDEGVTHVVARRIVDWIRAEFICEPHAFPKARPRVFGASTATNTSLQFF